MREQIRSLALELAARDVRRIADDHVDRPSQTHGIEAGKEIALQNLDTIAEAQPADVRSRDTGRLLRQVAGPHPEVRPVRRDAAREVARPAAHVDEAGLLRH